LLSKTGGAAFSTASLPPPAVALAALLASFLLLIAFVSSRASL
jgi:hypothetical protein